MKKLYFALLASAMCSFALAQSLSENFDSYSPGDYMGVESSDWTTWSGATGGAEDVQVTDNQALSGSNSIYFSTSAATGGPQDVVVPFGGVYNTGNFVYESSFYVESGNGAYFNFQATATIGQIWAMNLQMVQDGFMYMDDGVSVIAMATYPFDEWFDLRIEANLNTNEWELFVNDVSYGVGQNSVNQVASVDLFPVNANYGGNNQASFYIDDFAYEHTPYVLPSVNGAVTLILGVNGLAGQDVVPSAQVRNLGVEDITSFDLSLTYNGESISTSVSGLSLASLDYTSVAFTDYITLIPGENDVVVTISNVNGAGDDGDASDDDKTISVSPVVPAEGKMVLGEEGTGTWCQWCPRGAVFMDFMETTYYDYWAGVAVHNGDPMVYGPYDTGLQTLISGYPSSIVDRGPDIDPSDMEIDFIERIQIPPTATFLIGAEYDENTNELLVSLTTTFTMNATGTDFNIAMVVTEDGVTGTGSGYNQSNAYAGGNNGEMGGYENLPSPVPASQMVYDHVGRTIMPSFAGASGVFPQEVNEGDVFVTNYTLQVDPSWETDNFHIIGMVINNNTDQVDNAGKATFEEAVNNGFVLGINNIPALSDFKMFPNPTTNHANIELGETNGENVTVSIFTVDGRMIAQRNYGNVPNNMMIPLNTDNWTKGVYMVQVNVGQDVTNRKLVVQ
jgi:hypothetical protein